MSGEEGLPGNLKGYTLQRAHGSFLRKLIVLIIIILVILWFTRRELVFELWNYIQSFF